MSDICFPPKRHALQPLPDFHINLMRDVSPRRRLTSSFDGFGLGFECLHADEQSAVVLQLSAATFVPFSARVQSGNCSQCNRVHIGKCPREAHCERCGYSGHVARTCTATRAYNGNTKECTKCHRLTHMAHKCRAIYDCFHAQLR